MVDPLSGAAGLVAVSIAAVAEYRARKERRLRSINNLQQLLNQVEDAFAVREDQVSEPAHKKHRERLARELESAAEQYEAVFSSYFIRSLAGNLLHFDERGFESFAERASDSLERVTSLRALLVEDEQRLTRRR